MDSGQSMDVIEVDAASHRGIDYIRELRENVKFRPMASAKKIYIIDEVHMLTMESFNALLKTLEEPPQHILFILATTEYHKVPQTIISRCQVFNLKKVPLQKLQQHLSYVCKEEKITSDEEALFWIARSGDGSVRDSISLLEQSIHYCGHKLETEKIKQLIGQIPTDTFIRLTQSLLSTASDDKQASPKALAEPLRESFYSGIDLQRFIWEYLNFLRILTYVKRGITDAEFLELPGVQISQLAEQFATVDEIRLDFIFRELFDLLTKSQNLGLRNSHEMQILVEMKFSVIKDKLTRPSLSGVLQKLNQFSAALAGESSYSFEHELQKQFLGTVVDTKEVPSL